MTMAEYTEEARYLTDDRELKERNELVILQGGNGDWYVGVVPEGEGCLGRMVRLCTSGGASFAAPGLTVAISDAYRAMRGFPNEADDRPFPMLDGPPITWKLAEVIYTAYRHLFHNDQTLEQIAQRGGFGWAEVATMGEMLKKRHDGGVYNAWVRGLL